ncbi:MAG: hypothetical protein AAFO89_04910 [Planctomycetota bacterium]
MSGPSRDRGRLAIGAVGLALAAWIVYAALIVLGFESQRAAFDARAYHLVVIEGFAQSWPVADVSDYLSATTPGFHWLLAGAARLGASQVALELITAGIGALLVGMLAWWAARESQWGLGWLLVLPLAASAYVVHAGTTVLPDNAGWLGVLAVLLLCLRPPTGLAWVAVGLAMLGLVLTRQSHVWAAGVIVAAGWLGASGSLLPGRDVLSYKTRRTLVAIAAVLPAVGVLALFVWVWGGLVPPTFAGQSGGAHPDVQSRLSLIAPAFILMLVGLYAPFFVAWWWSGLRESWQRATVFAAAGAAIGVALALVGPSTFSLEAGREGGYWRLIQAGHVVADRTSVVLVALSAFGGAMAGACGSALPARRRWLLLVALAGFAAAQIVNANTWQRYYEPFVLMLLAVASALCARGGRDNGTPGPLSEPSAVRVCRVAGPIVLALGLAGLTATTLGRASDRDAPATSENALNHGHPGEQSGRRVRLDSASEPHAAEGLNRHG